MEARVVPSAEFRFTTVSTAPLASPFLSPNNLFALSFILAISVFKNLNFWKTSTPTLCLAAAIKGVKLLIQEQNSVPRVGNLILSLFADTICVGFNSIMECFWQSDKCIVCGNPVRLSLMNRASKVAAKRHFFPAVEEKKKLVLVLGGSLVANAINIALFNVYFQMLSENEELLHD